MPLCNSAFDRESAAACHAEMMALPRVASGRCKVAAVGMRLDARTRAAETLAAWAAGLKLPFVTALREAQVYVRGVERGLTLFDQPAEKAQSDLAQWKPLVDWLEPILAVVHRPAIRRNAAVIRPPLADTASVPSLQRLRPALVVEPARNPAANRLVSWFGWLTPPRFRQRPS
jgi:chromosome partitioning protein